MNYIYILNISPSNPNAVFTKEHVEDIQKACLFANSTSNSKRYGRTFTYLDQTNERTIQIKLESRTATDAKTVSSITRGLINTAPDKRISTLRYNGSILKANIAQESLEGPEAFAGLPPHAICATVLEIFFGQQSLSSNKQKEYARQAAEEIKNIVCQYKSNAGK